jgi:hypothetical protein
VHYVLFVANEFFSLTSETITINPMGPNRLCMCGGCHGAEKIREDLQDISDFTKAEKLLKNISNSLRSSRLCGKRVFNTV